MSKFRRSFIRWIWGLTLGGLAFVVLIIVLVTVGAFGPMPTFEELENPSSSLASEVIASDMQTSLGSFYIQNRSYVPYNQLSPHLIDALIATEDIRFREHSGIDSRGLARVLTKTLVMRQSGSGGGSTITQQLAKNLFPRDTIRSKYAFVRGVKLVTTKLKEWVTAVKLERQFSKDEIITMYFNTVPFGHNAYGVKMAAKTFFNTSPDSLNIEQSALLVGLVKGPSWYSPVRNPDRSLARRQVVLGQMEKYGYITPATYDSISQIPLELHYKESDHTTGYATYYRELLRKFLTAKEPKRSNYYAYELFKADSIQWANNPLYGWCEKNPRPDGQPYNIYTDGLKIYSTLDMNLQRYAEEAVREHLSKTLQPAFDKEKQRSLFSSNVPRDIRKKTIQAGVRQSERYRSMRAQGFTVEEIEKAFDEPLPMSLFSWAGDIDTVMSPMDSMLYMKRILRAGFIAIEPRTGNVRAYVGGIDFKHFQFDQVYLARRQVGSTIKPLVYSMAMLNNMSPCLKVPNAPVTFIVNGKPWTPKNSGPTQQDGQMVSLRWGLANSVNFVSAWLLKQFTPEAIVDQIHRMGIHSFVDPVPSIFLGTSEISIYEMAAAYNCFASQGMYIQPLLVSKIEDKAGNTLATFSPATHETMSDTAAYKMVNLLRSVVDMGSGRRLRYAYNLNGPLGGKTGTTQNSSDGWFMGIYPTIVMGTWVGCEDPAIHFAGMLYGQGAAMALPIQGLFLKKAFADPSSLIKETDQWRLPNGYTEADFDCDTSPDVDSLQKSDYHEDYF